MAYFACKPHKDRETNNFMESIGAILTRNISECSVWMMPGGMNVYIPMHYTVTTLDGLLNMAYQRGYDEGRQMGKGDALRNIQQNLSDLVYKNK